MVVYIHDVKNPQLLCANVKKKKKKNSYKKENFWLWKTYYPLPRKVKL
jgi:hypothetical protein